MHKQAQVDKDEAGERSGSEYALNGDSDENEDSSSSLDANEVYEESALEQMEDRIFRLSSQVVEKRENGTEWHAQN